MQVSVRPQKVSACMCWQSRASSLCFEAKNQALWSLAGLLPRRWLRRLSRRGWLAQSHHLVPFSQCHFAYRHRATCGAWESTSGHLWAHIVALRSLFLERIPKLSASNNSLSFTDTELKYGAAVPESHSQHILWMLHIQCKLYIKL